MNTYLLYTIIFILTLTSLKYFSKKSVREFSISIGKFGKIRATNQGLYDLLISLPLIILLSFRYGIGVDYYNYKMYYNQLVKWGDSQFEPLTECFMKLSDYLFHDYQCFLSLVATITVFFMIKWVRKHNNNHCMLAGLILMSLYLGHSMNIIVQTLACSIVVFSYDYLIERKLGKFLVIVIIASLVHYSAIIVLPLWLLRLKQDTLNLENVIIKKIGIIICSLLLAILYLYLGSQRGWAFTSYVGSTNEGGTINVYLRLAVLMYIPEIWNIKKVVKKNNENEIWYTLLSIELVCFIVTIFVPYVFRMGLYFSFAHIILVPEVIDSLNVDKNKQLMRIYYVLLFVGYFIFTTFICKYNAIYEYKSIFDI